MFVMAAALIQWFRLDSAAPEDVNIAAVYSTFVLVSIYQAGFALTCGSVTVCCIWYTMCAFLSGA